MFAHHQIVSVLKLVLDFALITLVIVTFIGFVFHEIKIIEFIKWISERFVQWIILRFLTGHMEPRLIGWYERVTGLRNDYWVREPRRLPTDIEAAAHHEFIRTV